MSEWLWRSFVCIVFCNLNDLFHMNWILSLLEFIFQVLGNVYDLIGINILCLFSLFRLHYISWCKYTYIGLFTFLWLFNNTLFFYGITWNYQVSFDINIIHTNFHCWTINIIELYISEFVCKLIVLFNESSTSNRLCKVDIQTFIGECIISVFQIH